MSKVGDNLDFEFGTLPTLAVSVTESHLSMKSETLREQKEVSHFSCISKTTYLYFVKIIVMTKWDKKIQSLKVKTIIKIKTVPQERLLDTVVQCFTTVISKHSLYYEECLA